MKIKNNSYNFGRCVTIAFVDQTKSEDEWFKIVHAPDVNPDWYVAMDITVTDRPSAHAKANPGFQGTVTIYNPPEMLINKINDSATWVNDYVKDNMNEKQRENAINKFYASRQTVTISAGYLTDDGKQDLHVILKGFIMGSSLARKGVEDVLTFGVFDENIFKVSRVADKELEKNRTTKSYENQRISDAQNKNKFGRTWYDTFVKYIKQFEMERLPDPKNQYAQNRKNTYEYLSTLVQQSNFPGRKDFSTITEQERPFINVSDYDRKRSDWFEVKFVKSSSMWKNEVFYGGRDRENRAIDVQLEEILKTQLMPSNGAVYGVNLAEMLDGICARANVRVGWERIVKPNDQRNTYLVYRLGAEPLWVEGKNAAIRIWNYQNLLESPSVSGSGIMTVKMVFNPMCECGLTLALMLDHNVVAGDKTIRDLTMSGDWGSMATSASIATFGTVQLGASNAVAAINKQVQTGKSRGYMFNIGFPIMSVKHELSTHNGTWTTTVQTVPSTAGLTNKNVTKVRGKTEKK